MVFLKTSKWNMSPKTQYTVKAMTMTAGTALLSMIEMTWVTSRGFSSVGEGDTGTRGRT